MSAPAKKGEVAKRRKIEPPRRSKLLNLPHELISHVFEFVPASSGHLSKLAAVCKAWRVKFAEVLGMRLDVMEDAAKTKWDSLFWKLRAAQVLRCGVLPTLHLRELEVRKIPPPKLIQKFLSGSQAPEAKEKKLFVFTPQELALDTNFMFTKQDQLSRVPVSRLCDLLSVPLQPTRETDWFRRHHLRVHRQFPRERLGELDTLRRRYLKDAELLLPHPAALTAAAASAERQPQQLLHFHLAMATWMLNAGNARHIVAMMSFVARLTGAPLLTELLCMLLCRLDAIYLQQLCAGNNEAETTRTVFRILSLALARFELYELDVPSLPREPKTLSDEQDLIASKQVLPGQRLRVVAFAGTGKTETLIRFALRNRPPTPLRPDTKTTLYVCYNNSLQADAKDRFVKAEHVECKTMHTVCMGPWNQWMAALYPDSKRQAWRGYAPWEIDKQFPDSVVEFALEESGNAWWRYVKNARKLNRKERAQKTRFIRTVKDTLNRFFAKCDPRVTEDHIPWRVRKDHDRKGASRRQSFSEDDSQDEFNPDDPHLQPERYVEVVLLAQRIWDRMLQGKQKFTFDATIKWLQLRPLSDIILRYDFILCDEAQDMSECQRFIIESQRKAAVIWIGDSFQQIYKWRHAVDILSDAKYGAPQLASPPSAPSASAPAPVRTMSAAAAAWVAGKSASSTSASSAAAAGSSHFGAARSGSAGSAAGTGSEIKTTVLPTMYLRRAFRFSHEIAFVANSLLALRGEPKQVLGVAQRPANCGRKECVAADTGRKSLRAPLAAPSLVCQCGRSQVDRLGASAAPFVVIARKNITLFEEALNQVQAGNSISIIAGRSRNESEGSGGSGSGGASRNEPETKSGGDPLQLGQLLEIYELWKRKRSSYRTFTSFTELKEWAEDAEDHRILAHCELVEKHKDQLPDKVDVLRRSLDMNWQTRIKEPTSNHVTLATAHQVKGLEFDNVRLAGDFIDVTVFHSASAQAKHYEGIHCLYVAATRARRNLLLNESLANYLNEVFHGRIHTLRHVSLVRHPAVAAQAADRRQSAAAAGSAGSAGSGSASQSPPRAAAARAESKGLLSPLALTQPLSSQSQSDCDSPRRRSRSLALVGVGAGAGSNGGSGSGGLGSPSKWLMDFSDDSHLQDSASSRQTRAEVVTQALSLRFDPGETKALGWSCCEHVPRSMLQSESARHELRVQLATALQKGFNPYSPFGPVQFDQKALLRPGARCLCRPAESLMAELAAAEEKALGIDSPLYCKTCGPVAPMPLAVATSPAAAGSPSLDRLDDRRVGVVCLLSQRYSAGDRHPAAATVSSGLLAADVRAPAVRSAAAGGAGAGSGAAAGASVGVGAGSAAAAVAAAALAHSPDGDGDAAMEPASASAAATELIAVHPALSEAERQEVHCHGGRCARPLFAGLADRLASERAAAEAVAAAAQAAQAAAAAAAAGAAGGAPAAAAH